MEVIISEVEKEVATLALCFSLVFVAGMFFGYYNGRVDGRKSLPGFGAYQPVKDRTTTPPGKDLEDFERNYRNDVLGKTRPEQKN